MPSNEPPYDPARWPSGDDPDATRVQGGVGPRDDDRTEAVGRDDRTRALDPVDGAARGRPPLEATVDHRTGRDDTDHSADPYRPGQPAAGDPGDDEPPRRWGKGTALVLLGVVLGFLVAFVVIALGTDPAATAPEASPAAMERIEELEAELGERDARIADLEAQLAEADADAGEADEAIAAQREALDARAGELDALADALNDREQAVAEREQAVQQREEAVAERERAADEGDPPPDEGDGGIELPDLGDDDVDGFIDQVLERIRDLF